MRPTELDKLGRHAGSHAVDPIDERLRKGVFATDKQPHLHVPHSLQITAARGAWLPLLANTANRASSRPRYRASWGLVFPKAPSIIVGPLRRADQLNR